ncbi:hypothetical protein [Haemophilus sputorum]|uniref:hypothetical protein n=1 Tax=Haemophilus sputorum TaxID=1078480 RepID=UPI0028D233E5|nr:hypothetical protein [Haemophilus sputorum]
MTQSQNIDGYSSEETDIWQVYEARKREIMARNLPQEEYERAIKKLTEELAL